MNKTNVEQAIETLVDTMIPKIQNEITYVDNNIEYQRQSLRDALWVIAGSRPPEVDSTLEYQREIGEGK